MRLIPPEGTDTGEVERAPMRLLWHPKGEGTGYGGHNGEYILQYPCITEVRGGQQDIPDFVAIALGEDLGSEWDVENRGSRIEIMGTPLGRSDHELISAATTRILEQVVLPCFGSR